uniref:Uncharacterized protein n=2 Tax=Oryza TaxID=4527 RepID=A0A0E0PZP5_ORYRU
MATFTGRTSLLATLVVVVSAVIMACSVDRQLITVPKTTTSTFPVAVVRAATGLGDPATIP